MDSLLPGDGFFRPALLAWGTMGTRRRAEYAEATRASLIEVARRLFADRGYTATSLDDIVAAARVTKGALYHHFDGKVELFAAVAEGVEADLTARVGGGIERDPWEALLAGVNRYLDAALEPEIQRILLLDAPTVLGYDRLHELQARFGLGLTVAALEVAMEAGALARRPALPLAHMLIAALSAGAMFIARADDRIAARKQIGDMSMAMLEGLRTSGTSEGQGQ
jgi:AcrR family transcriptional regulator